jgi:hypothetical protein
MRRSFPLPVATLAAALLLGCGDQQSPTPPADSPALSFRTQHSPDGPGAQVVRFDFGFFSAGPDPATGLTLTVGLVSPLADVPDCGGSGPVISDGKRVVQLVFTPRDFEDVFIRAERATMVLYESTSPELCDWVTAPVFARGTVNLTFHILSRTAAGLPSEIGLKFQGIVELTSGGRARVLNTAEVKVDPDGTAHVHVDRFEVKPIGH